jgi:hypothetical protein
MGKWQDISSAVYNDLKDHAALTALLSAGVDSITPILAEANEGNQFVNYYVQYEGSVSKDSAHNFQIVINAFAENYDKTTVIADAIIDALEAAPLNQYLSISGGPDVTDQEQFYIKQIFNIKTQ